MRSPPKPRVHRRGRRNLCKKATLLAIAEYQHGARTSRSPFSTAISRRYWTVYDNRR
jgi:hypothetical protein